PPGFGTGRVASPRANRGAPLQGRFAIANNRQRVLGVRSLLNHTDCDACPADARRYVTSHLERGAAGRTAWLTSPDVPAAIAARHRTRAHCGPHARPRTGSCSGGG